MLTLTAFIANAQPSAIAPRDYQQMLKKGIDVDWWGRSEKNKYGPIRKYCCPLKWLPLFMVSSVLLQKQR